MSFTRLDPDVLALLRQVSTATISGVLSKRGFRHPSMHDVRPLRPDLGMAGQAFTLRYIPLREDLERTQDFDNRTNAQRVAVERVGPGDVLVIDARGDTRAASLGHLLATRIQMRGAAGIVTDGAFRDSPSFRGLDMPTYARGESPDISFAVHHPSEMQVPIACGGIAVLPGDVVVGDGEGITVIPLAIAADVAMAALEQERKERFILTKLRQGSAILGVYPPDENTLREYEEWRRGEGI